MNAVRLPSVQETARPHPSRARTHERHADVAALDLEALAAGPGLGDAAMPGGDAVRPADDAHGRLWARPSVATELPAVDAAPLPARARLRVRSRWFVDTKQLAADHSCHCHSLGEISWHGWRPRWAGGSCLHRSLVARESGSGSTRNRFVDGEFGLVTSCSHGTAAGALEVGPRGFAEHSADSTSHGSDAATAFS